MSCVVHLNCLWSFGFDVATFVFVCFLWLCGSCNVVCTPYSPQAATLRWTEMSGSRVWSVVPVSETHVMAPLRQRTDHEFRHCVSHLMRKYCHGIVDADNRTRAHATWRRCLLDAFSVQRRNRELLKRLHDEELAEAKAAKKGKSKSKKQKRRANKQQADGSSPTAAGARPLTTGKGSDAGLKAAFGNPQLAPRKLPKQVDRVHNAIISFSLSKSTRCMTMLHELEHLHRHLRKQLQLFESDLRVKLNEMLSKRL